MGEYGLYFKKPWFTRNFALLVGFLVAADQFARREYNIPEYRNPNLTMFPWWIERYHLRSLGIDPSTINKGEE